LPLEYLIRGWAKSFGNTKTKTKLKTIFNLFITLLFDFKDIYFLI